LSRLLEIATKSHFGKGSETVYDENIRKAKEITKDKLVVKGIDFNLIERSIIYDFDIKHQLKFELHKLNFYEPTSFFSPHVDTLHGPNHIATLLIGLDFEYEEGELIIKCGDYDKISVKIEKNEGYCFFTDCEHEVLPVASGIRVTLQYNVYYDPTKLSHLARTNTTDDNMELKFIENRSLYKEQRIVINNEIFQELFNFLLLESVKKSIGIVLRHKYHMLTVPNGLKGFDKQLWKFLENTNMFNLDLACILISNVAEYSKNKYDYNYEYSLMCKIMGNDDINADVYITNSTNYYTITDNQYHGNEHSTGENIYSNIVMLISLK